MLNYIRAEIYKLLHRKYTYIALGIFLALEGLLIAGFVFHNSHSYPTYFAQAITFIVSMGTIGFCTCLLTGDMVFAGQYKNSTLKNEVSFGLSRTRIYLGKLIAQTLLSIAYLVVMMGFFIGLCAILLPHDPNVAITSPDIVIPAGYTGDSGALRIVGYYLAVGFPLWVGGQAATCACLFLLASDIGASFAAVFLTMMFHTVVELAGILTPGPAGDVLIQISKHMPASMLSTAPSVVGNPVFLGKAWLVGAFWVVVCTAVGLYGFHKKEIK